MKESTKRNPLIEVTGLNKQFKSSYKSLFKKKGTFDVLKDVSFTIHEKETVGIVGESGSGKTTLGECIGGLQQVKDSMVHFRGKCINHLSKQEKQIFRKGVQYVFQSPHHSVNPRFTVYQILQEPLLIHQIYKDKKEERKVIEQLLHDVGLEPSILQYKPHQLSGGQCQRVAIARALSLKPPLVICDEAVSALDASVQATIIQLLESIKQKYDVSFLFISHDLGVVRSIADQVIVLNKGEVVEQAPGEQLFNNPQHTYTKELLSSV